jgi:hypothetical protein
MSQLFDRNIRVVVGPENGVGIEFKDLRISFTIEKSSRREPNKAKIEIYNLSSDSAAYIESGEARNTIQLFAGYGDAIPRIFAGEIRKGKARTIFNGPDRITRIEASDGGRQYRSARINKSYDGQVTTAEIIDDLAKTFGAKISIPDDVGEIKFTQGFVASGASRDILATLSETLGVDAYFEDGVLRVSSVNSDTGEQAVLLTSDTGLVDTPEKTDKGVNGISLLNSSIRPKRIVEIRTRSVKGFFLVQKVGHKGDNFANEFYTEFEAKSLRTT